MKNVSQKKFEILLNQEILYLRISLPFDILNRQQKISYDFMLEDKRNFILKVNGKHAVYRKADQSDLDYIKRLKTSYERIAFMKWFEIITDKREQKSIKFEI